MTRATSLSVALVIAAIVVPAAPSRAALEDVVISEIMTANGSVIRDEDGDSSDWIELYNDGPDPVDLVGCYLTDNGLEPTKWRFPSVVIQPGGFLVVFASDKDRRVSGSQLHTNFRLSSAGEYTGLIAPDGETEIFAFAPYPPQEPEFSYGLAQNAAVIPLVGGSAPARALVPGNGDLGSSWTAVGFDDGGWRSGTLGVGYDRNADYQPYIGLDVRAQMEDLATSCFIRVEFDVDAAAAVSGLVLRVRYDDGFVAYLNGNRIASANAPAFPLWDSSATGLNDDSAAVVYEEFVITDGAGLLEDGENVLAIHGLNDNLGSSDFLIQAELEGLDAGTLDRDSRLFFPQPTPGSGNLAGVPSVATPPAMFPSSRVFSGSLEIEMGTGSPTAEIRYTVDGSIPTSSSSRYTAPFSLATSAQVRARVFEADGSVSRVRTQNYIRLASDVTGFRSDLPVVLVDNFGGGSVPANSFQPCSIAIFEPGAGQTALSGVPSLFTRAGIKIRGSSTQNRPKKAYAFEAWDEKNEDKDIAPFGLPEEADWILYGAYNFDRAHMRNAFIYEMSNQLGRYAVRTRFCEVFVNEGGGSLADADYVGVYTFMEKIDRDAERVNVERITAAMNEEPLIGGGYMWKIDRADPGDSGFGAAGQTLRWVYPKEDLVTGPQQTWVTNYFNSFASALNGASFRDPDIGYRRYIDPESWVDHHILNVLAKNVDALRLSTYFFKTREGKVEFGPIWDFDRSMNSTDGRDDDPRTWNGTGDGTNYFTYPWWGRLFQDPDFWQLWRDRWALFRNRELSSSNMQAVIDGMAAEIETAIPRESSRWGQHSTSSWRSNVTALKSWLATRASWIDSQFPSVPRFSPAPGQVTPGTEVTLLRSGTGTIYYTLDGSDPRLPGGGIAAAAIQYTGPIRVDETVRIFARNRESTSDWSGAAVETFYTELPLLVVTEIMYHPPDPVDELSPWSDDDFEFIELLNAGASPLELGGFRLEAGIEFEFPPVSLLPGEHVVVVENLEAFESRYDSGAILVAGQYRGNLDNLGDRVRVLGAFGEPILDFEYTDAWYPSTDGLGDSLVIRDPQAPLDTWGLEESWSASTIPGGTPGTGDDGFPPLGGRQLPGDGNQDGRLDISDGFAIVRRLFLAVEEPLPCEGTLASGGNVTLLDVNGDAAVDVSDAAYLLNYLFQGGPAPTLGTECVRIEGCPSACGF